MGKSYRRYLPDQDLLLPPSLREWLPENHLVYFVSDVVDNLNLSALDAVYGDEQRGQPPYDPRMMTKVLVYGYCVGVFSSRRIERRLAKDVGFRVLAAGNAPNFRTIADFRKLHLATLAGLFEEVLKLALEAGALKLGRVALDGTKVQANASKHKAMSYGRMKEKERQLRAEVRQLLAQAEAADATEDAHYGELDPFAGAQIMLFSDSPVHTRLKRLVTPYFKPGRINLLTPRIQTLTNQLLDHIESKAESTR